jgi:hypothetical protein
MISLKYNDLFVIKLQMDNKYNIENLFQLNAIKMSWHLENNS